MQCLVFNKKKYINSPLISCRFQYRGPLLQTQTENSILDLLQKQQTGFFLSRSSFGVKCFEEVINDKKSDISRG